MTSSTVADRYLARLGLPRPATADLANLRLLLEAHLRAIPFENVTSFLGSPVDIDPAGCFAKLLEGKRGGYCMEHALLSRTALAELGYTVEPRFARVLTMAEKIGAQTHTLTVVHLDGEEYIFDPGFGGYTPSIPLRISDRGEQVGVDSFRLVEAPGDVDPSLVGSDVWLIYEAKRGDTWAPMYGITTTRVVVADTAAYNWFVSTCPTSLFVHSLMCCRWDGVNRITGFNRFFKKREGDKVEEGEIRSLKDVDRWLRGEMRLELDEGQVKGVWEKLQKVHPVVPREGEKVEPAPPATPSKVNNLERIQLL